MSTDKDTAMSTMSTDNEGGVPPPAAPGGVPPPAAPAPPLPPDPTLPSSKTGHHEGSPDDVGTDHVSVPHIPLPDPTPSQIVERATLEKFTVDAIYESFAVLEKTISEFAYANNFCIRKQQGHQFVCSRATHPNIRKKITGDIVTTKREFSISCDCPWMIQVSRSKKILPAAKIINVVGIHNHDLSTTHLTVSKKRSNKRLKNAVDVVTHLLAPLLSSGKRPSCNLVRNTIKAHVQPGIVLTWQTIANMVRAAKSNMNHGNFTAPRTLDYDDLQAFTTLDIASHNCRAVLSDLLSNSDGDTTWIVSRLMNRLKEQDPEYFDFCITCDDQDHVRTVTWQTGIQRGYLARHYKSAYLDARKDEEQNDIRMRYMAFIVLDANHRFSPGSESFVWEENNTAYGDVVLNTLTMTPQIKADWIELAWADAFLTPEVLRQWLPRAILLIDGHHFCGESNKTSVLSKDFGPVYWQRLKKYFQAAVKAPTEEECLASIIYVYHPVSHAFLLTFYIHIILGQDQLTLAFKEVGSNQAIKDKISKWQALRCRWGLFMRNKISGHLGVEGNVSSEQNHSSVAQLVEQDASRPIEENIIEVMERTDLVMNSRTELKHKWFVSADFDIDKMDTYQRTHLSSARRMLDQRPFSSFSQQLTLATSYIAHDEIVNGKKGTRLQHTSRSNQGYFIADDCKECPCGDYFAFKNTCRHLIAKSLHRQETVFDADHIDPRHLFLLEHPRAKSRHAHLAPNLFEETPLASNPEENNNNPNPFEEAQDPTILSTPPRLLTMNSQLTHASPSNTNLPLQMSEAATKETQQVAVRKQGHVSYQTLTKAATAVCSIASSLGSVHCNAVLSLFNSVEDVLNEGDYDSPRHKDTIVGPFARQLGLIAPESNSLKIKPGFPKIKTGPVSHKRKRLGSDKSVAGKRPSTCSFCGGSGGGKFHGSTRRCPIMAGYGLNMKKVTRSNRAEIADEIEKIFTSSDYHDFSVGGKLVDRMFIHNALPTKANHVQLKGYTRTKGEDYVLATLIMKGGNILTQKEGNTTVSYADVFVKKTLLLLFMSNVEYVFFSPIDPKSN